MRLALLFFLSLAAVTVGGCSGATLVELHTAKKQQKPIFLGFVGATKPDKVGDVSARIQFFNTSSKVYKYVDFYVEAYNRVGDRVIREGDQSPMVKLRFTGPLASRRTSGIMTWPRIWYTTPVSCLAIRRINITYMDGTALTIEGTGIPPVLAAKSIKSCVYA